MPDLLSLSASRMFPIPVASLLIACVVSISLGTDALHGAESEAPDACVGFMKAHGEYLEDGRNDLADQADEKARAAGCYDKPGGEKLCALFAEQESQFNLDGRTDLVNIIRAQEREFKCIQ